jgi:adenine-specific DNA methylase
MYRGNLKCPCCGSITKVREIKKQSRNNTWSKKLLVVILEDKKGKNYRFPRQNEVGIVSTVPYSERPTETMQRNSAGGDTFSWGVTKWGQLYSRRQLFAIKTLVQKLENIKSELQPENNEYDKALVTYLGIWIDRIAVVNTSFGRWNVSGEKVETPFSKQAIPMIFDYPESNMFCDSTGSARNQLQWILKYINSESKTPFFSICNHAASGEKEQFEAKSLTAVITDPPYYDAIAYADLSDFFYIWLKQTLGDLYSMNFSTPQTPKTDECTALKHHHNNNKDEAKTHFENKLSSIFDALELQTSGIISIMFAHQSTEAWTTLCNSILSARMNITGSWAIDTEMASRSLSLAGATLESSVTVSCKPSTKSGYGEFKEIKKDIENRVAGEVEFLYKIGFRGADLLTACFGQAVSVFGQYERVEKADGSEVTVVELLEMAREAAFNALLKGFAGDDFTKFYIGWLQLYGFTESDFDDAAKFSRVGLTIDVQDLFHQHVLIKNGNKQTLGGFEERNEISSQLGTQTDCAIIDQAHKSMALYKDGHRSELLKYIGEFAISPESSFWRVLNSLCEVLPQGSEDYKQAFGLISNKENLLRDSRNIQSLAQEQRQLFD